MGIKNKENIQEILNQRIGQTFELIAHAGAERKMAVQAKGKLGKGAKNSLSTWTLKFEAGIIIFDTSDIAMLGGVGQTVIRMEIV